MPFLVENIATTNNFKLMATISTTRRNNLIRLRKHAELMFLKMSENKSIKYTDILFCDYIGLSTSAYSQLKKSKHKPYFNEVYARRIEEKTGLEVGWFDVDRDTSEIELIKINFKQFQKGIRAYYNFISSQNIVINNNDDLEQMEKNLFRFVFKLTDTESANIGHNEFLDFLKSTKQQP